MTRPTGKLPPKPDPRAPRLARLFRGDLPDAPARVDWTKKLTETPLYLNDQLGVCTVAAAANRLRVLTSQVWGDEYVLPDAAVRDVYFGLTGGADNGLYETDLLSSLAAKGLTLPGRQYEDVPSWATVDHTQPNELRLGVYWFGGIMGGFNLPANAEALFDAGLSWDVPEGQALTGEWLPGAGGGHEVYGAAYTPDGVTFLSWGKPVFATNRFLAAYLEECQVAVSRLWLDTAGISPDDLDMEHLAECMAAIKEGTA